MIRVEELESRLRADGVEPTKVRGWLEVRARPFVAYGGLNAADAELRCLAREIQSSFPLSGWEKAGAATRQKYARNVRRHAKALAALLRSADAPYIPDALGFFDESSANEITERMNPDFSFWVRQGTRFDFAGPWLCRSSDCTPYYFSLSEQLGAAFTSNPQKMAPLLDSLTSYVEKKEAEARDSCRANQRKIGDPERRVLARHLANYFARAFNRRAYDIIACCINITYPDADPPATDEMVRSWLDAR